MPLKLLLSGEVCEEKYPTSECPSRHPIPIYVNISVSFVTTWSIKNNIISKQQRTTKYPQKEIGRKNNQEFQTTNYITIVFIEKQDI